MTDMDVNTVTQLVEKFEKDFKDPFFANVKSVESKVAQLEADARGFTYDMVAGLVELAFKLDADVDNDWVKQFIINRSLVPARGSNNPFGPFIQAVFSVKVNGKWQLHEKHKSLAKHANHVRYLVGKKRDGAITGPIQDFIKSHPHVNGHGGLRAIEAQDRLDNPNDAQAKRVQETRRRGMNAQPKATMSNFTPYKDGDLVKLWGKVSQGQIEIMAANVANDDADSLWYQLGTTIPVNN